MDLGQNGKLPLIAGEMVYSYCSSGRHNGNLCMIYVKGRSWVSQKDSLSGRLTKISERILEQTIVLPVNIEPQF